MIKPKSVEYKSGGETVAGRKKSAYCPVNLSLSEDKKLGSFTLGLSSPALSAPTNSEIQNTIVACLVALLIMPRHRLRTSQGG